MGVQDVIDNYANNWTNLAVVVGVVLPDNLDGTLYCSTEPVLRQDQTKITPSNLTPFLLGSVSKLLTTEMFAVNKLQNGYPQDGSSPFSNYLKNSVPNFTNATVDDIVRYTSGLPPDNGFCTNQLGGWRWPSHTFDSPTNFMTNLGDSTSYPDSFTVAPGTDYVYSNAAFDLLLFAMLDNWNVDVATYNKSCTDLLNSYTYNKDGANMPTGTSNFYDSNFNSRMLPIGNNPGECYNTVQQNAPGGGPANFGAGGIVSNGDDMLSYLRYTVGAANPGTYPSGLMYPGITSNNYCGTTPMPTGRGWFLDLWPETPQATPWRAKKDGGVPGFTSYIESAWLGKPSFNQFLHGLFVLCNYNQNRIKDPQVTATIIANAIRPELSSNSELSTSDPEGLDGAKGDIPTV